jgi:hypothetical protein
MTGACCSSLGTTTGTSTHQKPRSDYVSGDGPPDVERRLLLCLPSRPGSGPCCRLFSRCELAACGVYRLPRGQPGPIPFRACRASRHLGALSLAQMLTDCRLWISPWSCSISDGAAGLICALYGCRCSNWNTARLCRIDPRSGGRPQPALTELACVAMVSLCRRWRDRCAGLSQTCRCFGVNAEGLEKVTSIGRLGGPRPATEKSWTPLLRIGDANSNTARKPDGAIKLHVTENWAERAGTLERTVPFEEHVGSPA